MEWKLVVEKNLSEIRPSLATNLERILQKKQKLDTKRPLPMMVVERIRQDLCIEWSYNSTHIEGNTLNLNETRMVLQDGITVKGKSLREHLEVSNHHEAIEFVEQLVQHSSSLNEGNILKIHKIVMNKIQRDFAGIYRNGMVRISGANFVPPNPLKVPALIIELLDFVHSNPLLLNDIEMASILHHRFVWIHPFFDGNGRTVRLLMNLFLMQKGYPPAIILANDRKKYYDALNKANTGSYEKLMLLICQAIERSLDIYLMAYPDGYEYKPILNIVEEEQVPYGQEYLLSLIHI